MSVRRLASGSWNYRKMINGKSYSFTSEEKLQEKDVKARFNKLIAMEETRTAEEKLVRKTSFGAAAESYLRGVEGVLSPSTLTAYDNYRKYIASHYGWFNSLPVDKINTAAVQTLISEYGNTKDPKNTRQTTKRSPKSVKNFCGFIMSVMKIHAPEVELRPTLPRVQPNERYVPTDEELQKVIDEIRTSPVFRRYLVPIMLASLGLRRSELCALTVDDLDENNVLTINKAMVKNKDQKWEIKNSGKTISSTRRIEIPEELADLIREQGYIFSGNPSTITATLHSVQKKLGIRSFSVHCLRHYFASNAISAGVPLAYVSRFGGWARGSSVLQRTYIHAQEDKIAQMDRAAASHVAQMLKTEGA